MNIRDGQRKFSGRTRYNAGHHSSTLDDMSSPSDPTRHSTARYNAIVVGTGPAGLIVGGVVRRAAELLPPFVGFAADRQLHTAELSFLDTESCFAV